MLLKSPAQYAAFESEAVFFPKLQCFKQSQRPFPYDVHVFRRCFVQRMVLSSLKVTSWRIF
jgi:hypothetical protein